MKKKVLVLFVFVTLLAGCEAVVDSEKEPSVTERGTEYSLLLKDSTGVMNANYNSDIVPNAEVVLKSNTLGNEYHFTSDENGMVHLDNVISDKYLISVVRRMTREEMNAIGLNLEYNLMKSGVIDIRADGETNKMIKLDQLKLASSLVISEIYACGPEGAGLYYHDKYLEVYNQSEEVVYLDGLLVAVVYASQYLGLNFVNDTLGIHTKRLWMFPGNGTEYPIQPGEFKVIAEDALDHTYMAPNSVDLSQVSFEFYKDDAPDLDLPATNMIKILQGQSENDWLIGGEHGALVLADMDTSKLTWYDDQLIIPYDNVIDGVEYLRDRTRLDEKILNFNIDAGAAGGIEFYSGKSMEREFVDKNGRQVLKDTDNSSLDFKIIEKPTPEFHYESN